MQYTPFQATLGDTIDNTCERAIQHSQKFNQAFTFDFNGVTVNVPLGETDHLKLVNQWRVDIEKQAEDWRNSPEGKESKRRQDDELLRMQASINKLMSDLPKITELDNILIWSAQLGKHDYYGLVWDRLTVINHFESLGYVKNQHVGDPKESFEGNDKKTKEWLVGQVIDMLYMGMCPHPGVVSWIEDKLGLKCKY